MTPFFRDDLLRLGACSDARTWVGNQTIDEAWASCESAQWMLWLLVRCDRRRGVGITVEVVRATCAHLAPDEVTTDVLNPLAAWAAGDDTVDVGAVRKRAWEIRAVAADAAWAAWAAWAVAAAAAADADADAAWATWAVAYADAQADMIRDIVSVDEVRAMIERTR